ERDLDGIGVLEYGQIEAGAGTAASLVDGDSLLLKMFMEEAEAVAAECGRAAMRSVDLEVLTARDIWEEHHIDLHPLIPSPVIYSNHGVSGKLLAKSWVEKS